MCVFPFGCAGCKVFSFKVQRELISRTGQLILASCCIVYTDSVESCRFINPEAFQGYNAKHNRRKQRNVLETSKKKKYTKLLVTKNIRAKKLPKTLLH